MTRAQRHVLRYVALIENQLDRPAVIVTRQERKPARVLVTAGLLQGEGNSHYTLTEAGWEAVGRMRPPVHRGQLT